MADNTENYSVTPPGKSCCCNIEAVVSIDERGQLVLPKDVREKANIKAGDKFAVLNVLKEGKVCCIMLIKADSLSGVAMEYLQPIIRPE